MKKIEIIGEFQEVTIKRYVNGYYQLYIDGNEVPGYKAIEYVAVGRDTQWGEACPRFSIYANGHPDR